MTTDLTKGNPARLLFVFTLPYLFGNLFQQLYNIADTVIVGRMLGTSALAAVGATGCLTWFALGFVMGTCSGFSVVTARYFGSGDEKGVKKSFAMSIILSLIISLLMTFVMTVFLRPILVFLNTPADIIDMSYRYAFVIFAGTTAMAMYNLLANQIRALGNSTAPLVFLIISSVINVSCDIIFIRVFNTGVEGAAYATVIAQIISSVLCGWYIIKKVPQLHVTKSDFAFDKGIAINLLHIGLPMGFLNMVLSLGSVTIQWATNKLSTSVVAAFTAASKLDQIGNMPIQSFGSALSVYVAQNYGAGKIKRVRQGVNRALLMGCAWAIFAGTVMVLFGENLMTMIVGSDANRQIITDGHMFVVINTLLMVMLSPVVVYKAALQPLGRALIPTLSGFVEIGCRACVAFFLVLNFGFTGLCFANPAAWAGALTLLIPEYYIFMKKLSKKELTNEL